MLKNKTPLMWEVNGQKVPITKDTIWYHGSPTAKLKPGDVLLPPTKTGNLNWAVYGDNSDGRDAVFITPDINQAAIYAGGRGYLYKLLRESHGYEHPDYIPGPLIAGAVYAVKPGQPIIPDDERPGSQFRTSRATITQVVISAVTEEQVVAAYKRDYRVYVMPDLRDTWWAKATALLAVAGLVEGLQMSNSEAV